jgi:iterative type I PKS product template protein
MYADLALTLANYMLLQGPNKLPTATTGLEVVNVKVENPLIARPNEITHCFRVSATTEWSSHLISMAIFSVDGNGKRTTSHAKLNVRVTPQQRWLDEWKRNTHLITARVDALAQSIHGHDGNNDSHMIKRGMAYKLFGALVQYSHDYQGMAEVVLDSKRLEGVSTVEFQVGQEGFHLNPRWIDSLGQIAGFIMNANDGVDSRTQVFINHGWEKMRIAEPLQAGKTYRSYNRMQLVEKTTYAGDTYVLDGGRIVAIFEGVTVRSAGPLAWPLLASLLIDRFHSSKVFRAACLTISFRANQAPRTRNRSYQVTTRPCRVLHRQSHQNQQLTCQSPCRSRQRPRLLQILHLASSAG